MQSILMGEREINSKIWSKFHDKVFPAAYKEFDADGNGLLQGKEITDMLNELRMRMWTNLEIR